ncbi:MAG: hypothetical protein K0Q55_3041 [Verrucomicrobia bacterium]|jgi:hypothetical protein|nr:hypothetical protein [Verrucomicrobiota bacterium]
MKTNSNPIGWRNKAAIALGVFGLSAMLGDLTQQRWLKGLGAVSMAAPFPKVFCETEGVEGFAADFWVQFVSAGKAEEWPLTPELYGKLTGPYNRRNVYGAALAGAPFLPEEMVQEVARHAFAPDGPLRKDLGLPDEAENIRVIIRSRTKSNPRTWTLEVS